MNKKQRIIILVWFGGVLLTCLIPPWRFDVPYRRHAAGPYSWLWRPPDGGTLDVGRLVIEWVALASVFAALWVLARKLGD